MTDNDWIQAGDYLLQLSDEGIVARNATGKVLKSVPAKAKTTPEFEQLDAQRAFFEQHDRTCLDTVRGWFLRGEEVPVAVMTSVWPDPSWRSYLENLLVASGASDGSVGLLLEADDTGLKLVDLDGETVSVAADASVTIPHPVVVDELDDWREMAVELDVTQGLDQLLRSIHRLPETGEEVRAELGKFADGKYERAGHLMGRARGGGYAATMDAVRVTVVDGEHTTVGEMQVEAWDSAEEATLGTISFYRDGRSVSDPAEIGPVAWSETIRMGEFVYAGRTVEQEEQR